MKKRKFDVELQIVLRKRFNGIELRCGEECYELATNDLKKKLLRGAIELDSFDGVDACARFFLPDGRTERFGFLVDDCSKSSTVRTLVRRIYWALNKMLRKGETYEWKIS